MTAPLSGALVALGCALSCWRSFTERNVGTVRFAHMLLVYALVPAALTVFLGFLLSSPTLFGGITTDMVRAESGSEVESLEVCVYTAYKIKRTRFKELCRRVYHLQGASPGLGLGQC